MITGKVEVLCDRDGSIEFGWVAPGVFFARFTGALSANMGRTYAARVLHALTDVPSMQYFCDVTRLTQYDLAARSTFFRMALEQRQKFASFIVLTWAEGVSQTARMFAAAMGEKVEVLCHRSEFEARLGSVPRLRSPKDAADAHEKRA